MLSFLGVQLDSVNQTVSYTPARVEELTSLLRSLLRQRVITRGHAASPQHDERGPSYMVEIVARLRTKCKVRWSYPPETFSLEQRGYMEKWYPGLVVVGSSTNG